MAPEPAPVAFSVKLLAVSTTIGPSPSVMLAETVGVPPVPTVTVTVSVALRPRESVAVTRNDSVVFAAGAVNVTVAAFVVAEARTDGDGPAACVHAYVTAPTPEASAVRDTDEPWVAVETPKTLPFTDTPVSPDVVYEASPVPLVGATAPNARADDDVWAGTRRMTDEPLPPPA